MAHKLCAANTQREYETVFLIKADVTDEVVDKVKERLRGVVDKDGGKVIKFTHWGKKKTAFPVEKQPRAFYLHVNYLGTSAVVAEVEHTLAIIDDVTKYMTTKIAEGIDPSTRDVEEDVKLSDTDEDRPRTDRDAESADDKNDDGED